MLISSNAHKRRRGMGRLWKHGRTKRTNLYKSTQIYQMALACSCTTSSSCPSASRRSFGDPGQKERTCRHPLNLGQTSPVSKGEFLPQTLKILFVLILGSYWQMPGLRQTSSDAKQSRGKLPKTYLCIQNSCIAMYCLHCLHWSLSYLILCFKMIVHPGPPLPTEGIQSCGSPHDLFVQGARKSVRALNDHRWKAYESKKEL